jgi:hypothetical protein
MGLAPKYDPGAFIPGNWFGLECLSHVGVSSPADEKRGWDQVVIRVIIAEARPGTVP